MSTAAASVRTVVITGGLGNLGSKLCRHLLGPQTSGGVKYRVVLLEHPNFIDPQKSLPHDDAIVLPCDLGNIGREDSVKLEEVLTGADAVVHFSAVNPYPNASWGESARSCDHAFNIFQLAVKCKVRRVILASSNHVMGGYKDDDAFGPGSVRPDSAPRVGTVPLNPAQIASSGDGKAYAAAKLAAERLAMTLGSMYGETTTFVVLRIGWCQPGENHPSTLSAAGSPPEFLKEGEEAAVPEQSEDDKKDELWYKRMWLSNRDFLAYFDAALRLDVPTEEAKGDGGPHRNVRKGFMLVNAMSRNSGAKWNLEETEKWLGVKSNDDSLA
ncbi:hypothetical protein ACHAXT_005735 [Thalassiosira profunda]